MNKISFKEYLESKEKLRESVEKTSRCTSMYNVKKYCRLVIGEKDNKSNILLKPNQTIVIEWFYPNPNSTPEPVSILLENSDDPSDNVFSTYWSGDKLIKWLKKNSIQKF